MRSEQIISAHQSSEPARRYSTIKIVIVGRTQIDGKDLLCIRVLIPTLIQVLARLALERELLFYVR